MKKFIEIMSKNGYHLKHTSNSGSMYFTKKIRVSSHYNNCDYRSMREYVGKYPQEKCLFYLGIKKHGWYGLLLLIDKMLHNITVFLHKQSYSLCQLTSKIGWYPLVRVRRLKWL